MKTDLLYRLIWMSRPLMQAAEAAVEKGLAGTGLTVRMRAVLEILHAHGDATVPDIARKLDINRQYVQLMVNETLGAGLTAQRPNPRHRRSILLALTEEGRGVIDQVIAREQALVEAIGADIDAEDARTALSVVLALVEKLKRHAEKEEG